MHSGQVKYKCTVCGWIGAEGDMDADDYYVEYEDGCVDEVWSNWICPSCNTWQTLEEYEVVK